MSDSPINDELAALMLAKKATLPEAMAADVLESIGDGADWSATLRALNDLRAEALGDPTDTKTVERMLLAQSVVLQSLFTHYMTQASRTDVLPKLQAFADLALKAQNQCRRTLATLAEIRNPRRTQFIKQVNNAVNQQVNNDKSLAAAESRKGDGWTLERRRWQSAMMQTWRPWAHSTGPRTPEGKARVSKNGLKHGMRGALGRELRAALRIMREAERELRQRI